MWRSASRPPAPSVGPWSEDAERHVEKDEESGGAAGDTRHQSVSVTTTGAWSDGFCPLRSSRSISTETQRAARAAVSKM